jgi:D-serine deaminase-like pyridoxal phosphate-dependent protein
MKKNDLQTPCLLLDAEGLEKNLRKMQNLATNCGKDLRPHAKTHKCSTLAKRQIQSGAIGACAAKLSEAEALIRADVRGILITGPLAGMGKITRLVNLLRIAPDTMLALDNRETASQINTALHVENISMDVLVDLDVGLHRSGVDVARAMEFADAISKMGNLRMRGMQAYAGHLQHISSYQERKSATLSIMSEAAALFRQLKLRHDGFSILSSSGTGTVEIDMAIPEITEVQVGSYVCMDTEYLDIGSAGNPGGFQDYEPALRLLTTVVSANHQGFVTVDAGLKALYRDGGAPRVMPPKSDSLVYDWFGDEYGRISYANVAPRVGDTFELIVSHCDPTINLFDHFFLTSGNKVVDQWPIDLRGCCQ